MVRVGGMTLPASGRFPTASRSIPDGLGGTLTLTAVWALLRTDEERLTGSETFGVVLAGLYCDSSVVHSRFAVDRRLFGGADPLRLSATRNAAAKAVASWPSRLRAQWMDWGTFVNIYGTPDYKAVRTAREKSDRCSGCRAASAVSSRSALRPVPYAPVRRCFRALA